MEFPSVRQDWADDPVSFWEKQASRLAWDSSWITGLDSASAPFYRWFAGGYLNAAYNCLDVHVTQGRGESRAVVFDSPMTSTKRIYTYRRLHEEVVQFAGALSGLQLRPCDTVLIYMPAVPESVIAMLACARLGVTHSVLPPVPAKALRDRIEDAQPTVILTASAGFENRKVTAYKSVLECALKQTRHQPRWRVVLQRPEAPCELVSERDMDWSELVEWARPHDQVIPVESGHPLYILYGSGSGSGPGSTAKPKGVVRDTGGYLTALRWAVGHVFGVGPGDVFWSDSHPGRVMGHSFTVYGALVAGCTTVLYEGSPVDTPDAGAFPRLISEQGVRVLSTTPATLRRIRREFPSAAALRTVGSPLKGVFLSGERVEPELMTWAEDAFSCPVVDNWWQTETGWPIASNCLGPGLAPIKPGSVARPLPGYHVEIVDETGRVLPPGEPGHAVIRLPLPPGCLQTLWRDNDRFVATYLKRFAGYFDTWDLGYFDTGGYLWIAGRNSPE